MHSLKNNSVFELSFSFGFIIKLVFTNSSSLKVENCLSPKIIVLSVCMPMVLDGVSVVVIRKHESNIEVVIKRFSLWCLL